MKIEISEAQYEAIKDLGIKVEVVEDVEAKSTFFEPKDGENAWFLDGAGDADCTSSWSYGSDKRIIAQGNAFETKEEAIAESEWRTARHELQKACWNIRGGKGEFVSSEDNHTVELDGNKIIICSYVSMKTNPSWLYFKTAEEAKQLLDTHSEELMVFLSE